LRVAYARAGFEAEPNPRQARFIESDAEQYLKHVTQLRKELGPENAMAWVGVAPHSVRAVPLAYLKQIVEFANQEQLPVHMHVAEQAAEVSACINEYGRSPIALLSTEGLLGERFTAVHAIHVTPKAVRMLAEAHASICACPTTERNLGDGIVPIDVYFKEGVRVSLGTDSQVQIDLLEDARELEYHLRLQKMERAVLAEGVAAKSALAERLFECATVNGDAQDGPADFFTVDLNDPSLAGATEADLLSHLVFSLSKTAVKDVVVDGKRIVEDGHHPQQEEIVERFKALQKRLWG
jgi:formimidoylglutamate deiminase